MPGFRGWPTLSVDGPLARTRARPGADAVGDGRAVAGRRAHLAGPRRRPAGRRRARRRPGLRVACSADLGFAPVEPDVRAAFARRVDALADAGWRTSRRPRRRPATRRRCGTRSRCAEGYASEGPLLAEWEDRMTRGHRPRSCAPGRRSPPTQYLDAQHERARVHAPWAEFFETLRRAADAGDADDRAAGRHPVARGDRRPAGRPVLRRLVHVLPAGEPDRPAGDVGPDRLRRRRPAGRLQVMGRRWEDAAVLEAAAAVERVLPPQLPATGAPTSRRSGYGSAS